MKHVITRIFLFISLCLCGCTQQLAAVPANHDNVVRPPPPGAPRPSGVVDPREETFRQSEQTRAHGRSKQLLYQGGGG